MTTYSEHGYQDEIADLRKENARMREALEAVRLGDVHGKPYLGFISENGCWSVEWPADGLGILREWMAKRDSALREPVLDELERGAQESGMGY